MLGKFLAADTPANASLDSAQLGFRGWLPWPLAIAAMIVALLLVWRLYAGERGRLTGFRRLLMGSLRIGAIVLLLLLIMRPVLIAQFSGERPREVIVLVDNTQSLKQRDRRLFAEDRHRADILLADQQSSYKPEAQASELNQVPNPTYAGAQKNPERATLLRAALASTNLDLLGRLRKQHAVSVYLFGDGLVHADSGGDSTKDLEQAITASEMRTALSDAILTVLTQQGERAPAAIIVATDGQDNHSQATLEEASAECARLGTALHIYGLGCAAAGQLQLKELLAPDALFFDDAVSVQVRWRARGLTGKRAEIELSLADKPLARKEVVLADQENQEETLSFVPAREGSDAGSRDLKVTLRAIGDDEMQDSLARSVRLMDRKVRVLYVEGAPRWQYKFLQTALLRDRRVDASFLLSQADPQALAAGAPYIRALPARPELFAYDLLILGDVEAAYFGAEYLDMVRDFVQEGGGLILIAGRRHAPAEYVDSPLADVLPVTFDAIATDGLSQSAAPFAPLLTPEGKKSDMLALADGDAESEGLWRGLPGWRWQYPINRLRPGAVALLSHPSLRLGSRAMPLLASQSYGKGQVLFLASDETWRWRYNAGDKYFSRFWGQVVYQLGLPHRVASAKRVQLVLSQPEFLVGAPGAAYARLLDEEFRPLEDEVVDAQLIRNVDGEEPHVQPVQFVRTPGQAGEYKALLPNDVAGRFEIALVEPTAASLEYRVNIPPQDELAPSGLAEEALRAAAQTSGGRFYREEDLHSLPDSVESKNAKFTMRRELLLWNPWALALFALLVSAEWTLRKFFHLS